MSNISKHPMFIAFKNKGVKLDKKAGEDEKAPEKSVCPKCGKEPCECKKKKKEPEKAPEKSVCPKCGKEPCEC